MRVDNSLGAVLATARKLEAANIPGVGEIAPAFASVAVFLESPENSRPAAKRSALPCKKKDALPRRRAQPRLIEVPAVMMRNSGPISQRSPNIAALRRTKSLRVMPRPVTKCAVSALLPDFLSQRAAVEARDAPARDAAQRGPGRIRRDRRRATGIYPLRSPGGWNIIGRTSLQLFDATRQPPAFLRTGDRVRFVPLGREDFARWV